jgi:Domain of unknown function (DUF4157)
MSNKLPERIPLCAANLLARREWFADPSVVSRAKLDEATGISRLLSSPLFAGQPIGAITLSRTIHFRMVDEYDPHTPAGLALLAHEIKHVEQYEKDGLAKFYLKYLLAYVRHGYGQLVPFEAEAYALQVQVETHLTAEFENNPGRPPCLEMTDPHTPNGAFVKTVPAPFKYPG